MAFHLGSLGFLTPFSFENFQAQVTQVIQGESRPWVGPTIPCGSGCPWFGDVYILGGPDALPLGGAGGSQAGATVLHECPG